MKIGIIGTGNIGGALAHRFRATGHDVAIATLFDERHQLLSEGYYFVRPREPSFDCMQRGGPLTPTRIATIRESLGADATS